MSRSVPTVAVPPVPESIDQPVLAWPEAVVLALAIAAITMFTWPLARAMWPWSKPREVSDKQSKTWVVAFVAIPVLLVAAYFIDGAVDDYYSGLRDERNEDIAQAAAEVAGDLAAETGYTIADDDMYTLGTFVSDRLDFEWERDVTAYDAGGVATPCILRSLPDVSVPSIALECPASTEGSL